MKESLNYSRMQKSLAEVNKGIDDLIEILRPEQLRSKIFLREPGMSIPNEGKVIAALRANLGNNIVLPLLKKNGVQTKGKYWTNKEGEPIKLGYCFPRESFFADWEDSFQRNLALRVTRVSFALELCRKGSARYNDKGEWLTGSMEKQCRMILVAKKNISQALDLMKTKAVPSSTAMESYLQPIQSAGMRKV